MSQTGSVSSKNIPTRERLILALDVPTTKEAKDLVLKLGDSVMFYKLGLELFMAGGYWEMLDWLKQRDKRVFVDLKFFDVPETVKGAVKQLSGHRADFATVHGNDSSLRAACDVKNGVKILAVTVLTSLDQGDMDAMGFKVDIADLVLSRARRALKIGCDGVISSGLEASALRADLGDGFLIVVPGIRPGSNTDDQKRTVDVETAFQNGADYIVVGRPIRNGLPDPKTAAEAIQKRISVLFP